MAAAAVVLWLGLAFGSRAATGADAFGYVSQAYLWLNGNVQIEQPLAKEFPWPHADESLSPLGYRPGQVRHTIVPLYSPGVPLIMAAFHLVLGNCGPYYVAPVFGALLVGATFVLGHRVTRSRLTAALAAVLMAGSPAFLFNLMFPMSDIVTASLWTWSLALLTWPRLATAAGAGVAAGAAVLARPNLVPLAIAAAAAAMLWTEDDAPLSRRTVRVLAFAAGVVPAALLIAITNRALYGSPFQSGYGRTASLYALAHFPTNAVQFTTWLVQSESAGVLLAACPVLVGRCRAAWLTWRSALPLAGFAAIGCASYLFYLPFDEWWYLRFLLPVFPILFVMLASALVSLSRAIPMRPSAVVLGVMLALLMAYRVHFAAAREFLELGYGEQRYIAVGQFIDRALPGNAVILSMQHSGSIRYYSGRLTVRYDVFAPARFPSVIDWFQSRGYRPYILLEDWEEKQYRARFGSESALARLEIRVLAEMTQPVKIRLYDPVPSGGVDPPPDPIPIRVSRECSGPRGVWQLAGR